MVVEADKATNSLLVHASGQLLQMFTRLLRA